MPPPERGIRMKKAGTTWWGKRWIEALEYPRASRARGRGDCSPHRDDGAERGRRVNRALDGVLQAQGETASEQGDREKAMTFNLAIEIPLYAQLALVFAGG
jgi:hypothetical protein